MYILHKASVDLSGLWSTFLGLYVFLGSDSTRVHNLRTGAFLHEPYLFWLGERGVTVLIVRSCRIDSVLTPVNTHFTHQPLLSNAVLNRQYDVAVHCLQAVSDMPGLLAASCGGQPLHTAELPKLQIWQPPNRRHKHNRCCFCQLLAAGSFHCKIFTQC